METNFTTYCKEYITDRLSDYKGRIFYLCDFPSEITMDDNVNGSITYSSYKAMEFIKEHFEAAGAYWNYAKDNFEEVEHNPFEEPEDYMVCMVIEGVNSLMSQVIGNHDDWDNQVEITDKLIKEIEEGLEDADIDWL